MALVSLQSAIAATLTVPSGGNLQSVLNIAKSGDTIVLQAGATYTGNFQLPANNGTQYITIQSSAMSSLPGAGSRVSASQANLMPKIVSPNAGPALWMTTGAAYYRIQGIEFYATSGIYVQDLIQAGTASEPSVATLPHDIDFDRDYIHGDPAAGGKRGIALNSGAATVENCYISGFFSTWQDTQAIAGWNGPGPYTIKNNYLEAGTETVAFGGAVPSINGVVPSDIMIQNNLFSRPLSWMPGQPNFDGTWRWVKNHFELKNAQRVTLDNNTFENNWKGADQRGFMLVFTVRTEVNQVPWAVVNNITVSNNHFRHSAAGVNITGTDDNPPGSGYSTGYLIKNNLFEDVTDAWGGDGRMFQLLGAHNVTIDHNTFFQNGFFLVFAAAPTTGLTVTNNISNIGQGVAGDGTGPGSATLTSYAPGGTFSNNALIGGNQNGYPGNNFFPASIAAVGFNNPGADDYNLSASSPLRNAGSDGKDLGSSFATASSTTSPAPVPTPAPGIPSGWVNIISQNSGKCADVEYVSTAPGAHIHQWDCLGADNQKFMFVPVTGGYEITVKNSNLQWDVEGGPGATWDGANLIQYPYWGGSNEIFQLKSMSDGTYEIIANSSGKCMDVENIAKYNGAYIHQWTCFGAANQKWSLVAAQ